MTPPSPASGEGRSPDTTQASLDALREAWEAARKSIAIEPDGVTTVQHAFKSLGETVLAADDYITALLSERAAVASELEDDHFAKPVGNNPDGTNQGDYCPECSRIGAVGGGARGVVRWPCKYRTLASRLRGETP